MHFVDGPFPPRRVDDEILAGFGDPVYLFVDQPRLHLIGWETSGVDGHPTEASVQYWVADDGLDFRLTEYPMGPFGTFARAWVHTDRPGSTLRATSDARSAIDQHLGYRVINVRINEPGFDLHGGSDEFMDATHDWQTTIEQQVERPGELVVDGARVAGIEVTYEGYTASSTTVAGRILTVITHADEPFVDRRVVRRR